MNGTMIEYLEGLDFGQLQQFKEMAILPVFAEGSVREYITLKEAMAKELIEITEIDDSGSVPELKVTNKAETPVLILDGEELMGAKQNRVVNTTILLQEQHETIIPVSCVEQGRWSYSSRNFQDSDRIASYKLRNVKSASVMRSVRDSGEYRSDQGAVWNEVHALEEEMEMHSPTSAMGDIFDAKNEDLNDYIKAFSKVEGQKGLLVFIDGEIMGLDVVSSESAYEDLHKKLLKSYALDAMVQRKDKKHGSDLNIEMAHKFIADILKSDESKNESVGYGFDYRFASESFIGSALVFDGEVIHTSFFKSLEMKEEEIGGMARYRQRVNFRNY